MSKTFSTKIKKLRVDQRAKTGLKWSFYKKIHKYKRWLISDWHIPAWNSSQFSILRCLAEVEEIILNDPSQYPSQSPGFCICLCWTSLTYLFVLPKTLWMEAQTSGVSVTIQLDFMIVITVQWASSLTYSFIFHDGIKRDHDKKCLKVVWLH